MSNYVPDELKNLSSNQQRVMNNVVNHLENKNQKKPGRRWQVGIMTAILAGVALFFIVNQLPATAPDNEQASNGNEQPTTGNELQSFFEVTVDNQIEMSEGSHSGWKTSPNGLQRATIYGKGEFAMEEGEASLVIESIENNETQTYQLKQDNDAQNTPKFVEWIDDNRLFVIVGFAHGTVTKGGQLYEMNLSDKTIVPLFENLPDNEEIMSIKANEDGTFTYQKHIYTDANYSEGYVEEGVLPLPATSNKESLFLKEDIDLTNIENIEIIAFDTKESVVIEDAEVIKQIASVLMNVNTNNATTSDEEADPLFLMYITNIGYYPHPAFAIYNNYVEVRSNKGYIPNEDSSTLISLLELEFQR